MQFILGASQSSNICYSTFNSTKNVACFGEDRCCCYDDTYHAYPTCCSCTSYWWLWSIVTVVIISTTASLIVMFMRRDKRLKPSQQQPSLQTVIKNLQERYQAPVQTRVQQRPYENNRQQQQPRVNRPQQQPNMNRPQQHQPISKQQRPHMNRQQRPKDENVRVTNKYVPPPQVGNKVHKKPVQVKGEALSENKLIKQEEKILIKQQEKKQEKSQENKEVIPVKSYEPNPNDPEYQRLSERDALFNQFLQKRSVNSQEGKGENR